MARPFRQQIDDGILDRAAALFAARGFAKTSVQDVATAVGLSKAGLLHHFPTKDALRDAVLAQARALGARVLDEVGDSPPTPERDRRTVEVLVDVALAHPGLIALLLAPVTQGAGDAVSDQDVGAAADAALQAFGVDPGGAVTERTIRVAGALAALAVLAIAASAQDQTTAWRPHIVATCIDALGSRPPVAPHSGPDQVEA